MSQPRTQSRWIVTVLLLLAAAAYLYAGLFRFPHTPVLQSDDQVYFWMDAQRMLNGERAYVDFFQYTPPGSDVVFLSLFKLFGPRIWVLNAAVIGLGIGLYAVCLCVAGQVLGQHLAALAAFVYLVFIFATPLNATHHWFSILSIMGAVAALMSNRAFSGIAVAGCLLGLASFFTHTHGLFALVAVSIFLIWEQSKEKKAGWVILLPSTVLCLSFVAAVVVLNAYFIASAGFQRLWYEQVTYVRKFAVQGLSVPNLGLPGALTWHSLPRVGQPVFVYILLPAIYLLWLTRLSRKGFSSDRDHQIGLLSLVGLALFVEVAINPNWLRIYAISMPGIVLAICLIERVRRARRFAVGVLIAATVCLAAAQLWTRYRRPYVVAELPAGRAAVPTAQFEEIDWITRHTRPGEFFFQAAWPGLYVPLGLRNPVFLDALGTNEQSRPEYVELAIQQMDERQVRYVLWSKRLDHEKGDPPPEDHLEPFRAYLRDRYERVKVFALTDELWQRK